MGARSRKPTIEGRTRARAPEDAGWRPDWRQRKKRAGEVAPEERAAAEERARAAATVVYTDEELLRIARTTLAEVCQVADRDQARVTAAQVILDRYGKDEERRRAFLEMFATPDEALAWLQDAEQRRLAESQTPTRPTEEMPS